MHYYLYEIKNNINGKIYIGVHKTKKLDDGYMGSGSIITRAIEKYGVENFIKTILETFESQEEMFAREKEIVTEEFLSREDTYNLRRGGLGGFDYLNYKFPKMKEIRSTNGLNSKGRKNPTGGLHFKGDKQHFCNMVEVRKQKAEDAGKSFNEHRLGTTLTNITKEKIAIANSGENNSQFGSMWITNGSENKKIKKTDPIPEGWYKGRKI